MPGGNIGLESLHVSSLCAYPSNKQMIIKRMSGQYSMFMCTEINGKGDAVVKRRFDCPLRSSPVRESTAVLKMH